MKRVMAGIAAVVLIASATDAQAPMRLTGNICESFSDRVAVSGIRLVGLVAGPLDGIAIGAKV